VALSTQATVTDTLSWFQTFKVSSAVSLSTLTITVQNVSGGNPAVPAAGTGKVELFDSSGVFVAREFTDSNRQVRFTGLKNDTYSYTVEHTGGWDGAIEFWGKGTVTVDRDRSITFTRNQPYIISSGVRFFDNATNAPLDAGSSIPSGTVVRAEISVNNPGGGSGTVHSTLFVDRDRVGPFDVGKICGSVSITTSTSSTVLKCTFTPPATGTYFAGVALSTQATVTDTLSWFQTFTVQ
jgi:hypothetical protein